MADADGRNVRKLIDGHGPVVASGRPAGMYYRSTPTPTPPPTGTGAATPTKTPTSTKTPKPTKTPTPRPSKSLTLQTSSPTSVDAGQSVKLGLRNKWGQSGETHPFECAVVAPDGSRSTAQGILQSDQWAYVWYPRDFGGASATTAGKYEFICEVEGQRVEGLGFTATGSSAPPDPDLQAAISQLRSVVEARNVDALMGMAYGGSMVFGYYASEGTYASSAEEKRTATENVLGKWAMQYTETGAEQRVANDVGQGMAGHGEATDRAVVVFRTGGQVSQDTPQALFLPEKIDGRWWWTSLLLSIFDVAG